MVADPKEVAFIGLGAMGFGMAKHLISSEYSVTGFDVWAPSMDRLVAAGGLKASSPAETVVNKTSLICMVANADQLQQVLFQASTGAVEQLAQDSLIIVCSTVPSSTIAQIRTALDQRVKAADGTLSIFASGSEAALTAAKPLLDCMSGLLHIIPGGLGSASNVKMINQLLAGVHIATAAEAMALAAKAGLNTRTLFEIITNAAGNSWMFANRVPHMLDNDWQPRSALDIFVKDMGIVTSTARSLQFPVPLSSAAEQLYLGGSAKGFGREDDAGLVRTYLPGNEDAVYQLAKSVEEPLVMTPPGTPTEIKKIGFIGLGAMGAGMAQSLLQAGLPVHGYDVYEPATQRFAKNGGQVTESLGATADYSQLLILMVQNQQQVLDVLFGTSRVASRLPQGATVVIMSTIPPSAMKEVETKLLALGKDLQLVDAPVSGGVVKAAAGELTIICSGTQQALASAKPALVAMGSSEGLYIVPNGVGAASTIKMINQLLAGVHIVAAAEAMALAARIGLDTRATFEMIKDAAGGSWMFANRAPAMLDADWTPHSALAIFVKDLAIVLDEAKRLGFSAPMSACAHQMYLASAAHGWTGEADSGVVRFWELLTGVSVSGMAGPKAPRQYPALPAADTLAKLPPPNSEDVLSNIQTQLQDQPVPKLVVLDDDPTGTQTCHDIVVLTSWDVELLKTELQSAKPGFFILTNSRALPPDECKLLIAEICQRVKEAAESTNVSFQIVLRGDSTLRGHISTEPEAVEDSIGKVDAWVLAPFFYQGGRYTIDDVHYVKEGEQLVPAAETAFAKDATFGYKSSNLRDYICEKAGKRFKNQDCVSVSLTDIRTGGVQRVTEILLNLPTKECVVIVNAAAEQDMYVFAAGALQAELQGKKLLYRTGAAFVSARLGITPIAPLTLTDLSLERSTMGGLIIAGSYVPKTTAQLATLRSRRGSQLTAIELDVEQLIKDTATSTAIVERVVCEAEELIKSGHDVLIMTSRKLVTGECGLSSLRIGSVVAKTLVDITRGISTRPKYLIAKGGITSSDAATQGLGIRKALIVGQAAPGVPIWRCDEETSRHVGLPYVVFPGNVGSDETLAELVERWS